MDRMTLTQMGEKYGLTDKQLVEKVAPQLGMSESKVYMILAIERGASSGDILEDQ